MLEILSLEFDHRVNAYAANGRASYGWYLEKTEGSENNLSIQRSIITAKKTYETLRHDLKRGCILPPLVIGVQNIKLPKQLQVHPDELYLEALPETLGELKESVSETRAEGVQIIDGLQRTNAIRSVASQLEGEELNKFLARPIRIEFWINIGFYSLAYRMLLLNAGQKPMSMKHQIEILADSLRVELASIPDIEILRGLEKRRRVAPGQFQLSTLASAFQAWIQKQPNVDLRNAITEQLLAEQAVESLGSGFSADGHKGGAAFNDFVGWIVQLDHKLGRDNLNFLGNETVMLALSAASSYAYSKPALTNRYRAAIDALLKSADAEGANAMAPHLFNEFRAEIDPKRSNVGQATREFVYRAFSEYLVGGGERSMEECWLFASAAI